MIHLGIIFNKELPGKGAMAAGARTVRMAPPAPTPWGRACCLELNAAARALERKLHAVSTLSPKVFNDPNAASPLNR